MPGKGWVAAGDLVVDDEIHTLDGDTATVTGFTLEKLDTPIAVYNIEVEDFNSYFVGGGVLVHNKCEGTPRGNKRQNEQARKIAQILKIKDPNKIREIHDIISGENLNYKEALEEVRKWFER